MVRIFDYVSELDCFVVNPAYKAISDRLGLTEWNEVVWIGRYFAMDNDLGEHWFDNWELREGLEMKAKELGFDSAELFILDPDRFKDGRDGPCHSGGRKGFVLEGCVAFTSPELRNDFSRSTKQKRRAKAIQF